jgi:uncharacterized membrane protein
MSARSLRITLTVLTVAGLGIAGYLTYVHYAEIQPVCTAGDSCIKVQSSVYSELAGVPVALIGLLGYVSILGLLLARESENTRFAMMALTLVGFAFSGYLTYRELFSIHAICEWCATSAAILTVMAPCPSGGFCARSQPFRRREHPTLSRERQPGRPRPSALSRTARRREHFATGAWRRRLAITVVLDIAV